MSHHSYNFNPYLASFCFFIVFFRKYIIGVENLGGLQITKVIVIYISEDSIEEVINNCYLMKVTFITVILHLNILYNLFPLFFHLILHVIYIFQMCLVYVCILHYTKFLLISKTEERDLQSCNYYTGFRTHEKMERTYVPSCSYVYVIAVPTFQHVPV